MNPAHDPVTLGQRLIRCASVTPADAGAIAVLEDALKALGFACHRLEFGSAGRPRIANLYARLGTSGRNFCFAGHTDVVPVGDPAAWADDPFGGLVRRHALYGRGAADMKGAIAAFVGAVVGFTAAHPDGFGGSISLLITGDEEGPATDGTVRMLEWLAARGERIDVCLVGEPTSDRVVGDTVKIGRRGSLNATLTVQGVAGHVAYPHLADNPAHRLTRMLADLIGAPIDESHGYFAASSLQITSIDIGNPASNVIPGTARAAFNLRFNDRWTGPSAEAMLRHRLAAHGTSGWDLAVRVSGEAFVVPPDDFATLVAGAVEAVTGHRPDLSTSGGTSDARFIHKICPVAELGLLNATAHKVDEQVALADLALLARLYQAILATYFATGVA